MNRREVSGSLPGDGGASLPVGDALPDWTPARLPPHVAMEGRFVRLEPLDPALHAEALFRANEADATGDGWTYLPYGPFENPEAYRRWTEDVAPLADPDFYTVIPQGGRPAGLVSYLRIQPPIGSIEVGHIRYAPILQRTRAGTEAMYLMMRRAFDELGYRRYEWKCDALNAASRRAAERLGFQYEGTFRQATIYKDRNRDTSWYAVIDGDWPAIRAAFESWLSPTNFDDSGAQRRSLQDCRREAISMQDGP